MEATAKLNNCPMSPRKMRLVIDQIRGERVENAMNLLKFNQKRAYADPVSKLLRSAIANWEEINEARADEDSDLIVKACFVNQGRTIKRIRPAPQGRAHRIRKRSNHVTIVVDSKAAAENKENEIENAE